MELLDLSCNRIKSLSCNVFSTLKKLRKLNISYNYFQSICSEAFKGLNNLEELVLNGCNSIEITDKDVFSNIKELNEIEIIHSTFLNDTSRENLLASIKNLNNLRRIKLQSFIYLNHSFLDKSFFDNFQCLDTIDLSSVILNPDQFKCDLSSTSRIRLNNILNAQIITQIIAKSTKLSILEISSSNLQIDGNNILEHFLPINQNLFSRVVCLNELNLVGNKLNEIDIQIIKFLTQLKKLDLSINFISKIDKDIFSSLKNLKYLNLSSNGIEYLSEDVFSRLNELESLDISCNSLKNLNFSLFSDDNSLISLSLTQNKISALSESFFKNLKKLRILNLQNNKLKIINDNLFDYLFCVEEINLSSNEISSVDSLTEKLKNLKKIDVYHNRIEKLDLENILKLKNFDYGNFSCNLIRKINMQIYNSLIVSRRCLLDFRFNPVWKETNLDGIDSCYNINCNFE